MNFSLTLLVAMALFIMATAQEVGCKPKPPPDTGVPSPADPTDPEVMRAVDFAVADSYDMDTTTYKILNGTQQSVNGRKYDLDVAVTETADGYCTVFNYVVNVLAVQSSTTPYVLLSSTELDQQC
jgi:Cystatin domain